MGVEDCIDKHHTPLPVISVGVEDYIYKHHTPFISVGVEDIDKHHTPLPVILVGKQDYIDKHHTLLSVISVGVEDYIDHLVTPSLGGDILGPPSSLCSTGCLLCCYRVTLLVGIPIAGGLRCHALFHTRTVIVMMYIPVHQFTHKSWYSTGRLQSWYSTGRLQSWYSIGRLQSWYSTGSYSLYQDWSLPVLYQDWSLPALCMGITALFQCAAVAGVSLVTK